MARGINKVIVIGNLGADPEVRQLNNEKVVVKLRVATSEAWKDKTTGQLQERTEWHRVAMFDRLGEIAQQYLRKGAKIYIEGRLQTTKWQDQAGHDRYTTEIIAREMQMLDSRRESGGPPPMGQAAPATTSGPAPEPMTVPDGQFDDIPF